MKKKSEPEKQSAKGLTIRPIVKTKVRLKIRGITPLLQHQWSETSLISMRLTAPERKKLKKKKRDPQREAKDAAYMTADGSYGIPVLAVKAAITNAAHKDFGVERTLLCKALFVDYQPGGNWILPMEHENEPTIREDVVRVGIKQADLRYRPEFWPWALEVPMILDAELVTPEELLQLVERAGFSIGIGDWRPECKGEFGRFEVDSTYPVQIDGPSS